MTITQFEEVTNYLLRTFGKADKVDNGHWGWYYNDFSIYVSMNAKLDRFSPTISMFYNSPANEQRELIFKDQKWTEGEWFIGKDLKEFIDKYEPEPLKYIDMKILVSIKVPEHVDIKQLTPKELARQYGVK